MSEGTTKEQVHDIFAKFGRIEKISIVMDTQVSYFFLLSVTYNENQN